jgi:hypothetical protein
MYHPAKMYRAKDIKFLLKSNPCIKHTTAGINVDLTRAFNASTSAISP